MIQFVVTCAKAKRGRVPAAHRLCSVRRKDVVAAAEVWVDRLRGPRDAPMPACGLYRGDHWTAAAAAGAVATAAGGRAWVVSAGYGLIPFDAPVAPYSATFTSGDPDSVSRFVAPEGEPVPVAWWSTVAGWEGPSPGTPRRVADLAARFPADRLVLAVSEPYLRALTPDLLAARDRLAAPDHLLVLCGGAPEGHLLAGNLVRWDTGAQLVPGALASMNARVAHRLLREVNPRRLTLARARELVAAWAAAAPARVRPDRAKVSDDEVRAFIRDHVRASPPPSPSALHRAFRDSGRACERLRFISLYRATTET